MGTRTELRGSRGHRRPAEVRAARVALVGVGVAGVVGGAVWLLGRTWRRMLPAYWAGAELATAWCWSASAMSPASLAAVVLVVVVVAGGWPARSWAVRAYRMVVSGVLGGYVVPTVSAGPGALAEHSTLAVFGPVALAAAMGWPWWHSLRGRVAVDAVSVPDGPADEELTERWARRWQERVVANGVCKGTTLTEARSPRRGVIEGTLRLSPAPGLRPSHVMRRGPEVEVALDLAEGSVGFRSTGRAAQLVIVMVAQSYIAGGVEWRGPTYRDGRCQLTTYSDGTAGMWTFLRPGFGALNGLIVGSTGAGKSRALAVLIINLLQGGWMVVVGDPQYGQSLPDFRDAVEYHDSPEAVEAVLRRYHAEVAERSRLLARAGVSAFDPDDPRVQALGLRPMMMVIDECQMVLVPDKKAFIRMVEDIAATSRKTGVGLILGTQLPQMRSLGGSIKLRDALVAGNVLALRLSNRGSGTTVLPDGFVGDPFELAAEIDGRSTAGMGYLRSATQVGMLSRVPMVDEAEAAARCPRVPVEWRVAQPKDEAKGAPKAVATPSTSGSTADRLRAAFGVAAPVASEPAAPRAVATPDWVLNCLRKAPASAQALLDRPDCPVGQAQLYEVLRGLVEAGGIKAPPQRGTPYTLA